MSAQFDDSTVPPPIAGGQEGDHESGQTYEQIKAELEAVKAQNAKYSTALHTFTKRLDKFEAAARAIPDIDEHLTSSGAKPKQQSPAAPKEDQSLRERLERIEARERSQKEREKLSAIKTALEQHDVDGPAAARLARLIAIEQADRISVDDNLSVSVDDAGNTRSVGEWIRDYLQTDDGKVLIPPKRTTRNNSSAQSSGSGTGKTKISVADFGRLSLADIQSGKFEISD